MNKQFIEENKSTTAWIVIFLGILACFIINVGLGIGIIIGFLTSKNFNEKNTKNKVLFWIFIIWCSLSIILLVALFIVYPINVTAFIPLNFISLMEGTINATSFWTSALTYMLIFQLTVFLIHFFYYDTIQEKIWKIESDRLALNDELWKENEIASLQEKSLLSWSLHIIYNYNKTNKRHQEQEKVEKNALINWDNGIVLNKDHILLKQHLNRNMLTLGTTGAGKTNFFLLAMKYFLNQNQRVIFLDLKGSLDLIDSMNKICKTHNKTFKYFVQVADQEHIKDKNCITYDILSNKSAEEIIEMLLKARNFEDVSADALYYADLEKNFLDFYIPLIKWCKSSINIDTLIEYCNPIKINELLNTLAEKYPTGEKYTIVENKKKSWIRYIMDNSEDIKNAMNCFIQGTKATKTKTWKTSVKSVETIKGVENLLFKIKGYSNRYAYDGSGLSIKKLIKNDNVDILLISLAGLKSNIYAKFFGQMVVNDVRNACELNKKFGKTTAFFIDEYNVIACPENIDLLNKIREFNFCNIISVQTISDLGQGQDVSRFVANCNNLLTFRIPDYKDSDYVGKCFTTKKSATKTFQADNTEVLSGGENRIDNKGTISVEETFAVSPSDLRNMPDFTCYVKTLNKERKPITFEEAILIDQWDK